MGKAQKKSNELSDISLRAQRNCFKNYINTQIVWESTAEAIKT